MYVLTVFICVLHVACTNPKIAIKRELGLLGSTLLTEYSYQSNSISKATPPYTDTPTSACSIIAGMKSVPPVLSQQHTATASSKGRLSGNLRPLSLPKPTIILPFAHSKTMTILKDGNMKPVPKLYCMYAATTRRRMSPRKSFPLPPAPYPPAPSIKIPLPWNLCNNSAKITYIYMHGATKNF